MWSFPSRKVLGDRFPNLMRHKIIDPHRQEVSCRLIFYVNDPRGLCCFIREPGCVTFSEVKLPLHLLFQVQNGLKMQLSPTLVFLRKAVTACLDWPVPADRSEFLAPPSGHQMSLTVIQLLTGLLVIVRGRLSWSKSVEMHVTLRPCITLDVCEDVDMDGWGEAGIVMTCFQSVWTLGDLEVM